MPDICFKLSIFSIQICKEPDFLTGVFYFWSEKSEPNGLGSKFPFLFRTFYSGLIENSELPLLLQELKEIEPILKSTPVEYVQIISRPLFSSCLSKFPSQIKCFENKATDAYSIFKSFIGNNLFEELKGCVEEAIDYNSDLEITNCSD